jgi:hypothetical protein
VHSNGRWQFSVALYLLGLFIGIVILSLVPVSSFYALVLLVALSAGFGFLGLRILRGVANILSRIIA